MTDPHGCTGHSRNNGAWITAAISGYKYTLETDNDGQVIKKPLRERNPKWLNDDYVKFIRFAQLKMDAIEEGVIGIITNHSWLDNPTFRGMRQSLMRSFEQIYVIDLHGNTKKKKQAPDGSKDDNVFDIEQGVAISLFIKRPGLERGVWRSDIWGRRLEKYKALADTSFDRVDWIPLQTSAPWYLFERLSTPIDQDDWSIPKIFVLGGAGIVTAHDDFSTDFATEQLLGRYQRFKNSPRNIDALHQDFGVAKKLGWDIGKGWDALQDTTNLDRMIYPVLRYPFDTRHIFYQDQLVWRTVRRLMGPLAQGHLGLITIRKKDIGAPWSHVFVVNQMMLHHAVSSKEVNYVYPIRGNDGHENLSPEFRGFLDGRYEYHYTPEEILGYIYAILHAPTYRTRYAEFLRIDFPRVPFPESAQDFETLSGLGWALVEAQLLRDLRRRGLATYYGKGDHTVESVRYSSQEQIVWINQSQHFKPVPENVWEFHIGGYQVLENYLKARKGRCLSLDEINHFSAIADSLCFTIEQMTAIDRAYEKAFADLP